MSTTAERSLSIPSDTMFSLATPENEDAGYIGGAHVQIFTEMAQDAISQFCQREGDNQKYTLDPDNIPTSSSGNTCMEAGMAECSYYYHPDGSRGKDHVGEILVRISAAFMNPGGQYSCSANQEYEVQGERCYSELGKLIGKEPNVSGKCVGSDPSKLDLGSFLESGDKGCVLWNFGATSTGL